MTKDTNEWAHFVGGRYTPSSFMREARKFDVSRNITPQQTKGLKFGDVVNLMQWTEGEAKLFGQFVVTRVFVRDSDVSSALTKRLLDEGRARPGGGGETKVMRDCGSYVCSGGVIVNEEEVSILEIVKMEEAISTQLGKGQIKCMVGGKIVSEFSPPISLGKHGPKFSRGFIRFSTGAAKQQHNHPSEVVPVEEYTRSK